MDHSSASLYTSLLPCAFTGCHYPLFMVLKPNLSLPKCHIEGNPSRQLLLTPSAFLPLILTFSWKQLSFLYSLSPSLRPPHAWRWSFSFCMRLLHTVPHASWNASYYSYLFLFLTLQTFWEMLIQKPRCSWNQIRDVFCFAFKELSQNDFKWILPKFSSVQWCVVE